MWDDEDISLVGLIIAWVIGIITVIIMICSGYAL